MSILILHYTDLAQNELETTIAVSDTTVVAVMG